LLQSSEGDEWEVELSAFNGVENETCEFLVKTGTAPGSYSWVARYSNAAEGGPSHAEVSSSLSFDFRPHALSLAVWDLPSPVISGETIFVKVGAKCGNDCPLEGYPLRLCDEKGVSLASVTLGSEPWEGSQALYWAPASFKAPKETGTYTYHVHTDASKDHGAARGEFSFYVAQKPGCTVSIVVKDKESEAFLPLATVALHPYSACTDEAGYASVPAVVGQAKLTVKAADYESRQLDLVVTGDTSLVVMLTAKPKYEGDF
jgi:hypothetical protein